MMQRGLFVRGDDTRGTSPVEARNALAGLVTPSDVGGVLTGMVVAGTDGWAYQVGAGVATVVRGAGDGVIVMGNDAALSVVCDPAPASGARYDLVWVLHHDVDGGDTDSEALGGVTSGTAAGTPTKPYTAVPAGATVLAECLLSSDDVSTAGASIQQVARRVVGRGGLGRYPSTGARDADASARDGDAAWVDDVLYVRVAGTWRVLWRDTDWVLPVTYGNGYTAYNGSGWQSIRSRVVGGVCYVNGAFQRATAWTQGQAICQLVTGHRPASRVQGAGCQIDATGNVLVNQTGTGAGSISAAFPV
ncbi:hypothetical protein [Cellulosimicrobium sp. 22601]|uniref:hypothetical protein n=1 Tax=unclassified Cellulosimicrobium TaxID=2624466 RepID=UPI003F83F7FA